MKQRFLNSAWIRRGHRFQCANHLCVLSNHQFRSHGNHLLPPDPSSSPSDVRPWDQELSIALHSLVNEFRRSGHLFSNLDPLLFVNHPERVAQQETISPTLSSILNNPSYRHHEKEESSLEYLMKNPEEKVFLGSEVLPSSSPWWSFQEVVDFCSQVWCGPLSVEVSQLASEAQREWWISRLEQTFADAGPASKFSRVHPFELEDSAQQRLETLKLLIQTHELENNLQSKFPGAKRFGLEGAESLVPLLHSILQNADDTTKNVEFGMAHRGRLNVLCTILNKPIEKVLAEFASREHQKHLDMGDVKYHLGTTSLRTFTHPSTNKEHQLRLNLSANPSHLEAIDPVVMGRVRAHYDKNPDESPLGIVIHGDAAVSGQGVVSETLQLSELDSYHVGGRIHVVLNNQLGFTTSSRAARSSLHCTDVFKGAASVPIIHVNGDYPDLVRWAGAMAMNWRATYKSDVIIDLVCYRRRGHNEQDDPTQSHPRLYRAIENHPPVRDVYGLKLLEQGVLEDAEQWKQMKDEERLRLDKATDHALNHPIEPLDWFSGNWQSSILDTAVNSIQDSDAEPSSKIGIDLQELETLGEALFMLPKGLVVHPDVGKLYKKRKKQIDQGNNISWATAEALAFGSLVQQGIGLRLAGQDCQRGTFNQRHAVIVDQDTTECYTPLQALAASKDDKVPLVKITNSNLSEEAALAFEYGYSLESFKSQNPTSSALVLWEAQFGDFVNGAQAILDTFISSGESKWKTKSALVLLLPHGAEGQGPDHSSARPERFLQLCGEDADFLPGDCPSHRRELEVAFDMVDKDGSGDLDRAEMAKILLEMGITDNPQESNGLFEELDKDKNGSVDRDEWVLFMRDYLRRDRNSARMANLLICCPTTPANYFHLLRRQALDPLKPLVVFTPKSLLHHGPCSSSMEEMVNDAGFQSLLFDEDFQNSAPLTSQSSLFGEDEFHKLAANGNREPQVSVKRVLLCSGKIAYDLRQKRRKLRLGSEVVIARFEQLSPFPFDTVAWMACHYPNAEFVWIQEEPKNFGFWAHVQPRIDLAFRKAKELTGQEAPSQKKVSYSGRIASSATASASFHVHFKEQQEIVDEAYAGIE